MLPRLDVWAVIAGLLAKFLYVRYLTRLTWSKCAVVDVTMNVAFLNLIAAPAAFWVWTPPRLTLNRVVGTNDAGPANWLALLMVMALITEVSDVLVL